MYHRFNAMKERDKKGLQVLCREYLTQLRYMAEKHGLGDWLGMTLHANRKGECEGTRKEVSMLSRLCNDERIKRSDIPAVLGRSYTQCCKGGDFAKISRLPRMGVYSKIDVYLLAAEQEEVNNRKI